GKITMGCDRGFDTNRRAAVFPLARCRVVGVARHLGIVIFSGYQTGKKTYAGNIDCGSGQDVAGDFTHSEVESVAAACARATASGAVAPADFCVIFVAGRMDRVQPDPYFRLAAGSRSDTPRFCSATRSALAGR